MILELCRVKYRYKIFIYLYQNAYYYNIVNKMILYYYLLINLF